MRDDHGTAFEFLEGWSCWGASSDPRKLLMPVLRPGGGA
jgi:hypothetical protein